MLGGEEGPLGGGHRRVVRPAHQRGQRVPPAVAAGGPGAVLADGDGRIAHQGSYRCGRHGRRVDPVPWLTDGGVTHGRLVGGSVTAVGRGNGKVVGGADGNTGSVTIGPGTPGGPGGPGGPG